MAAPDELDLQAAELLARLEEQNRLVLEAQTKFKASSGAPTVGAAAHPDSTKEPARETKEEGSKVELEPTEPLADGAEWGAWSEVVASWDMFYKKKSKRLAELVYAGIPTPVRGMVWVNLANSKELVPETTISVLQSQASYPDLLNQPTQHEKYIVKDIPRTYPGHEYFSGAAGQETLYNVIKAYANYDSEVGYCQGSPFIVGILLLHMPEEEAFTLFCKIMRGYGLRGLFKPSMADLPLRLFQLDGLIHSLFPALHSHFTDIDVKTASYASAMFLSMFGTVLPLDLVCRVMDIFLLEGIVALFKFALAILADNHDRLLLASFEEAMKLLSFRSVMEIYSNADSAVRLMDAVGRIAVTPKRLGYFEKEYREQRAREEKANSEMAALRLDKTRLESENKALEAANKALRERVAKLESENSMLAQRLLDSQSRAQRAEEHASDLSERISSSSRLSVSEGSSPVHVTLSPSPPDGSAVLSTGAALPSVEEADTDSDTVLVEHPASQHVLDGGQPTAGNVVDAPLAAGDGAPPVADPSTGLAATPAKSTELDGADGDAAMLVAAS